MSKPFPSNAYEQMTKAIQAWKVVDPEFKALGASVSDLEALVVEADNLQRQITALLVQLTDLRNRRDATYQAGWQHVKNLRMAVKGQYGDDSSQYEVVGGTRLSERKPWTRRAKPNQNNS